MGKAKDKKTDSCFFWNSAARYLDNELPNIRRKSPNTASSYRRALNKYIDYLEEEKALDRRKICYRDFSKENLKEYIVFLSEDQKLKPKSTNLYLTAIRSLLAYASEESSDIMPIFLNAKNIRGLTVPEREIEYFEGSQLRAILEAPDAGSRLGRRNRIILVMGYDAALRVGELIGLKVSSLHLDADTPYVTVLGKGIKYRNIPLMDRTVQHLKNYLKEFHKDDGNLDKPLFFATTHGIIHGLSDDTIQGILKKAAKEGSEKTRMPDGIHFHMLRKTRAMDLYQAGCPLSYIQQLLGHENISTTSGFYAFVTLETLASAIEKANPSDGSKKIWDDENVRKQLYRL